MRMLHQLRYPVVLAAATFALTAFAGHGWQSRPTVISSAITAVSAPSLDFAIGVGNGGAIVRFDHGNSGTLMNSGTSSDFFDVFAASSNLAVATGLDTVRLWDGVEWSEIKSSSYGAIYTGAWIAPEQDIVLYGVYDTTFGFVCPYVPGAAGQGFCRSLGGSMLTACGRSNDIKIINTDGEIYNVDNALGDLVGSGPIHTPAFPLNLTAVYAPLSDCIPGPTAPQSMFAIRNFREFWSFDGQAWSNSGVSVPGDQTLTALAGTGTGLVIASGYRPDGNGGNEGVAWIFDGSTWTEDLGLPSGTPGLLDVSVNMAAVEEYIFSSSFDPAPGAASGSTIPGVESRVQVVGELGRELISAVLQPARACDVATEVTLLTTPPISILQNVDYRLRAVNTSAHACADFTLSEDRDGSQLMEFSDTCAFDRVVTQGDRVSRYRNIPGLAPGEAFTCNVSFVVSAVVNEEVDYRAAAIKLDDFDYSSNFDGAAFIAH
ncbi:MAG: hypothetical protein WCD66_01115 [Rhodanobacteraceae bacterium]